jgi:hypothetical protein
MRFTRLTKQVAIAAVALGGAIAPLATTTEAQAATPATTVQAATPAPTHFAWHWSRSQSHTGGTGFNVRVDVPAGHGGGKVYEIVNGNTAGATVVRENVPAGAGRLIASKPVSAGHFLTAQFFYKVAGAKYNSRVFKVARLGLTTCLPGVNTPFPAGQSRSIYLEAVADGTTILDASNANLGLQSGKQLGGVYATPNVTSAHAEFPVSNTDKVICSGAGVNKTDVFLLLDGKPTSLSLYAGATS